MKEVERLAEFVSKSSFEQLSQEAIKALKIRILDSIGCAIGALKGEPILLIRSHLDEFGGAPLATLIGNGKTAPDRAAFYNGALIRYLDYNDSFLAKKETCHPSDNLSSVLACSEYIKGNGKELLTALALAYQIQCRLSEEAPVRDKGFDHTVQGSFAASAAAAKALHLSSFQIANAIAISAVAHNALRVTRTGPLSHWKGLAYPETAFNATHAAFLAKRGITGPIEIFEGNKGFMHSISGRFHIDWKNESLEAVTKTIIKKYNAEIHSQSAIEGIIELKHAHALDVNQIQKIDVEIFDVAFNIIGGGEEGNKLLVKTKEEADHSLPYMLAAALLDDEVTPRQYQQDRIIKSDIQNLLKKIRIRSNPDFSKRFPKEMCVAITINKTDGSVLKIEKTDYEGFLTYPMSWDSAWQKFYHLAAPMANETILQQIGEIIENLEKKQVSELMSLLGKIQHQ